MTPTNQTQSPATEQQVITGNTEVIKRELEKWLAEGWRVTHLAGVPGQHGKGQFVAILESPKQPTQR